MLPIPFFQLGGDRGDAGGPPLAWISGPLIFDTGEADRTYLYRCQDRFLGYNTLAGLRSLLLVTGRDHRQRYERLLPRLQLEFEALARYTGLRAPPAPEPLYVPVDWQNTTVQPEAWFREQDWEHTRSIRLNQLSPSAARILREIAAALPDGAFLKGPELAESERIGALALRFHDKAEYLRISRDPSNTCPHVPTAVAAFDRLSQIQSWPELLGVLAHRRLDEVFLKSAFDSGGNGCAIASPETFLEAIHSLREPVPGEGSYESARGDLLRDIGLSLTFRMPGIEDSVAQLLSEQRSRRSAPKTVLLQERILGPVDLGVPRCAGICCDTQNGALFAAGQLFRDSSRTHYLGSYLNLAYSDSVLEAIGKASLSSLCALFAGQGYRGPFGFDACLDSNGIWKLIYDGNPRLTAVYPAAAVWNFLNGSKAAGCERLLNLGYRGEWNGSTLEEWLERLDSRGVLYCVGKRGGQGILPLPNLSRPSGCDLVLVNVDLSEASGLLERAGIADVPGRLFW